MINFFRLHRRLISRFNAERRLAERLNRIRAENPSCTVMSSEIYDVNIGANVAIREAVRLNKVDIGDYSYIAHDSVLNNVTIGRFCSIAPHVEIGLARHPSRTFVSTHPAFFSNQNSGSHSVFRDDKIFDDSVLLTNIDNDVWVGQSASILGGIDIGTGAIIAAYSVVVKDVPPYAIMGGNPAKVIRYRFSKDQIKTLLESEWWTWSEEKIVRDLEMFSNIDVFLKYISR